jgi:glycosyltransferase involved in cell wall biosynthesis
MTIFGALRVKNEARWIREVINSIAPLCERIVILDDHSEDFTDEICERYEQVTLIRSPFEGADESRDREFLLSRVLSFVSDVHLRGNPKSPFFCLACDGDEVMTPHGVEAIKSTLPDTSQHAFKLPIWYLWNDRLHRRVDGVYRNFARPSLFRLMNSNFRFQRTPYGANFHCSSIPQEMLHHAHAPLNAPLLHLGYMDVADRLRKYEWYNRLDPNNESEQGYIHMVQGDIPEVPASAKLKHAGPLEIITL